jgi:hypothetical protein
MLSCFLEVFCNNYLLIQRICSVLSVSFKRSFFWVRNVVYLSTAKHLEIKTTFFNANFGRTKILKYFPKHLIVNTNFERELSTSCNVLNVLFQVLTFFVISTLFLTLALCNLNI